MLKQRIVTGVILFIAVLYVLFKANLNTFVFIVTSATALGAWEWSRLTGFTATLTRSSYVLLFLAMTVCFLWYAPPYPHWLGFIAPLDWQKPFSLYVLIAATLWWCLAFPLLLIYPKPAYKWYQKKWLVSLLGLLVLFAFWFALISIRSLNVLSEQHYGAILILHWMSIIWGADIGAYFAGKQFGRRQLASRVSPKKTWEGVAGGVAFASIVAAVGWALIPGVYDSVFELILISTLLVFFSVIGDLTESIFKREQNLKDSGVILPGHGGLLDRIDSLLSTAPIIALCLIYLGLK